MIDATSLRIGNWVNSFPSDRPDKAQTKQVEHILPEMWGDEVLQPIFLTSRWLTRAGFKKTSHKPGYTLGDDFEKEKKCVQYSLDKITIMDWGNGFILSNSFSFDLRVEIKYVHKLQNLIYEITGKELEFK